MLEYIDPKAVRIEGRQREDFGDMQTMLDSVKKNGVLQPITVNKEMKLLAGERRLRAAIEAGLTTIPALVRPVEDKATELEIELAENIHRKDFTWQETVKLEKRLYDISGTVRAAAEIIGVSKSNFARHMQLADAMEKMPELDLHTFSTEFEAWKRLSKVQEGLIINELQKRAVTQAQDIEIDEGNSPLLGPPKTLTGDHYIAMANSNYKIGNCIDEMEKLIQSGAAKFDFAEVDPPYGIDLANLRMVNTESAAVAVDEYKEVPAERYEEFMRLVVSKLYLIMKDDSFLIWWFGPTHFSLTQSVLTEEGFTVGAVPGIWYKGDQGQTQSPDTNLANCYEMFWVCRKGRPVIAKPGRSNVFMFPNIAAQQRIHPTERPFGLTQELLNTFTVPMHRVIVPFLGSGNTLRAAYMRRTPAIGWDINDTYKPSFILNVQKDFEAGWYNKEEKGASDNSVE